MAYVQSHPIARSDEANSSAATIFDHNVKRCRFCAGRRKDGSWPPLSLNRR